MESRLSEKIKSVKLQLAEQAKQVEQMVELAMHALDKRCHESVQQIQQIEQVINKSEIKIELDCLKLLALQSPVAIDLRQVATIFKINGDLERIGDLALNVSERAESLIPYPNIEIPEEISQMVKVSLEMLRDANKAFEESDLELAEQVRIRDDHVDSLNSVVIGLIISQMKNQPDLVEGLLHLFSASRIVERIGDHATNIAEDVIYLVEGEIRRHQFKLAE